MQLESGLVLDAEDQSPGLGSHENAYSTFVPSLCFRPHHGVAEIRNGEISEVPSLVCHKQSGQQAM